jgi:hypothetical protein
VVPITPERIIEFDELLGASANDVSFDGLANKVMVQGEAISAPPGRADHFAWRQPDFDSARGAPELAQTEPPRISIVAEKDVPSSNEGRANGTATVAILQTLKLWIGQVADQVVEKVISRTGCAACNDHMYSAFSVSFPLMKDLSRFDGIYSRRQTVWRIYREGAGPVASAR